MVPGDSWKLFPKMSSSSTCFERLASLRPTEAPRLLPSMYLRTLLWTWSYLCRKLPLDLSGAFPVLSGRDDLALAKSMLLKDFARCSPPSKLKLFLTLKRDKIERLSVAGPSSLQRCWLNKRHKCYQLVWVKSTPILFKNSPINCQSKFHWKSYVASAKIIPLKRNQQKKFNNFLLRVDTPQTIVPANHNIPEARILFIIEMVGTRVVVLDGDLAEVGDAVTLLVTQFFGSSVLLWVRTCLHFLLLLLLLLQLTLDWTRARTLSRVPNVAWNFRRLLLLLNQLGPIIKTIFACSRWQAK